MQTRVYLFIIALLFGLANAYAANSGVTYQGRILKPDGSPLAGANTQFKMQIRTPDSGNCLMYEELQALDMRTTNGTFSLTINDGTGTRTDSTGLGLDRIFANRGAFAFSASTCSSGAAYTPNNSDGRLLVVYFKDETMASWEPIPAQKINFVPFAFESKQVGGFVADSLLRVVDGSNEPLTGLAPLSNAQYTELMALLNGTTTQYSKTNQLGGNTLPSMNSGEVLGWNGTSWVSTTSTPGANSITATMLQSASVTGAKLDPAISISTTGTVASAITTTRDFKIYAASPSTFFVGMAAPALGASYTLTWPLNAGASGQFLTTNGSGTLTWTTPSSAGITDLTGDVTGTGPGSTATTVASVGGSTAALVHTAELAANAATNANTASTIVKRDASGNFGAGVVTANGLALNNAGSVVNVVNPSGAAYTLTLPANPGASGQVLTTNGSGVTSWISQATSPWTVQAPGINYMGGNVGIGTTSPVARLEVFGDSPLGVVKINGGDTSIGTTRAQILFGNRGTGESSQVIATRHNIGFSGGNTFDFYTDDGSAYGTYPTGKIHGMTIEAGRVGVGTTAPSARLDVAGSLRVGDGGETCDSTITGAIRYNGGNLQFCAGTMPWTTLGVSGSGIASLTGDVTATGPGAAAATVASVGGSTAALVHTAELAANAATAVNTASTIVKRDASGNFAAGAITQTSSIYKDSGANNVTIQAPTTVATSYVMKLPTGVAAANGQVLTSDTTGNLSWTTMSGAPTGVAGGDLSGTYPNPGVATVGTSTAANVHSAELLANAATAANTNNAIVKRDGTGNFTANVATVNGVALNNAGSVLNIVNPVGAAYTLTLPAGAGVTGQVLTTNGSGTTSWTSPLTSSSGFVQGGNSFGATANLGTNDGYNLNLRANGTTAMTVATNGKVGIGTTVPNANFDIGADTVANTTDTVQRWTWNPSSNWGLRFDQIHTGSTIDYAYRIKNSGTDVEAIYMRSSGNIGIGTTSPVSKLSVAGAVQVDMNESNTGSTANSLVFGGPGSGEAIGSQRNSGLNQYGLDFYTGGTAKMRITNGGTLVLGSLPSNGVYMNGGNMLSISGNNVGFGITNNIAGGGYTTNLNNAGTSFDVNSSGTNVMRVQYDGKVGIGTTSPGAPLTVQGALTSSASPFNQSNIDTATTAQDIGGGLAFGGYSDATTVSRFSGIRGGKENATSGNTAGYVALHTRANGGNVTEKVRVDSQGNMGVGTTAPSVRLDVYGSARFAGGPTSNIDGELFYDTMAHAYKYYDGNAAMWKSLAAGNISYTNTVWDQSGGNTSYTTGYVGIGTSAPAYPLDITTASGNTQTRIAATGSNIASTTYANASNSWTMGANVSGVGAGSFALSSGSTGTALTVLSNGTVGIGTTAPGARLSLGDGVAKDGSFVAKGFGTLGTDGDALSATGAGTRMLWYPKKGAFRAGTVSGTQWDDASIGINSIAMGADSRASGVRAVALGAANAVGGDSVALGWNETVGGGYSAALGVDSEVAGNKSYAIGAALNVSGSNSTALGNFVQIAGNGSVGIGAATSSSAAPKISANHSVGVFMGDQSNVDITQANAFVVLGGNVGIGTSAPQSALDVNGAIRQGPSATNNASLYLQTNAKNEASTTNLNPGMAVFNASGNVWGVDLGYNSGTSRFRTRVFSQGGGDVAFSTAALNPSGQSSFTDNMVVSSSGNVGIGTVDPQAKLHVGTASSFMKVTPAWLGGGTWIDLDTTGPSGIGTGGPGGAAWIGYAAAPAQWTNDSTTGDIVYRNTGKLLFSSNNPNSTMAINGANVGIGTASPAATLDINGVMKLKQNSSSPATCNAGIEGTLALTTRGTMCNCHTNAWVSVNDGITACVW